MAPSFILYVWHCLKFKLISSSPMKGIIPPVAQSSVKKVTRASLKLIFFNSFIKLLDLICSGPATVIYFSFSSFFSAWSFFYRRRELLIKIMSIREVLFALREDFKKLTDYQKIFTHLVNSAVEQIHSLSQY